jgi:hypothetical protein
MATATMQVKRVVTLQLTEEEANALRGILETESIRRDASPEGGRVYDALYQLWLSEDR